MASRSFNMTTSWQSATSNQPLVLMQIFFFKRVHHQAKISTRVSYAIGRNTQSSPMVPLNDHLPSYYCLVFCSLTSRVLATVGLWGEVGPILPQRCLEMFPRVPLVIILLASNKPTRFGYHRYKVWDTLLGNVKGA